jgi:hypothetical protein
VAQCWERTSVLRFAGAEKAIKIQSAPRVFRSGAFEILHDARPGGDVQALGKSITAKKPA